MIIYLLCIIITCITVVDPDLQVRGGGGGGGGHPDPLKRGSPVSKKIFFGPSGLSLRSVASVWSKNNGGVLGPSLDLPLYYMHGYRN